MERCEDYEAMELRGPVVGPAEATTNFDFETYDLARAGFVDANQRE